MTRMWKLVIAAAVASGLASCATTGEVRSTGGASGAAGQAELANARKFDSQILAEKPTLQDAGINAYVSRITERLISQRPPQSFPIQLRILDDDTPNAFTTGGGFVYIHTGLLTIMRNEAELAMVLGHEFAHVDIGHIEQGKRAAQGAAVAGTLLGAAIDSFIGGGLGSTVAKTGANLAVKTAYNSFNRDQERQADDVGFRYITGAGYNGAAGARAFKRLAEASGPRSELANFFLSTHPLSQERLATLDAKARQQGATKGRVGEQDYRRNILNRL